MDPEEADRDGHHEQRADQHALRADLVRERAGDEARAERGGRVHRRGEPREAERDPAHVVQVDDQERQHDPVTEGVRQPADLQDPDRPRELGIQAAEVLAHGWTVSGWSANYDRGTPTLLSG